MVSASQSAPEPQTPPPSGDATDASTPRASAKTPAGDGGRPKNLSPVLKIIPAHCYENPNWIGLAYTARDFVVYFAILFALLVTDVWWQVLLLWVLAGFSVSGLFIIGHDAGHGALFKSDRLNGFIGRLTMLPSLHVYEGWKLGHNRIHHGHTVRQGMDFVWHPRTLEDWQKMTPLQRLFTRIDWSWIGSGFYYGREIWWNVMMQREQPKKWADKIHADQRLVKAFMLVASIALFALGYWSYGSLAGGAWVWFKLLVMPAAAFMHIIGWTVYMHHIAPDIRWYPRHAWNKFRGQMEGTTIFKLPPGLDFFFHHIFTHVPHHVDMRIPFYHLEEAALAIRANFHDVVSEKPLRLRDFFRYTRVCKLYDFEAGRWLPYP